MRNSVTTLALLGVLACGSPQNENVVGTSLQRPAGDDKKLGLSSATGDKYASSVTGLRTNIDIAFGSFVNYVNAANKRCSGFLAKDYVDIITGYTTFCDDTGYCSTEPTTVKRWAVYFYTARHCFEVWTPIGIRSEFAISITQAQSYINPWLAANAFNPTISATNPQRWNDTDGRKSDIIRIPQPLLNPDKYPPVCAYRSSWSSSDVNSYQAIGYTNLRKTLNPGVVWANMTTTSPSDFPLNMKNVMKTATNDGAYRWANGIKVSPGDSGSPIWGIKRAADGVGVDKYTCIVGVVTRELWVNQGCDASNCKMRGESVFEKIKGYSNTGGVWTTNL